jgi:hypothetical protein
MAASCLLICRVIHGAVLGESMVITCLVLCFLPPTCALVAYCDNSRDIPILVVRRPELSQLRAREQINPRNQEPNEPKK